MQDREERRREEEGHRGGLTNTWSEEKKAGSNKGVNKNSKVNFKLKILESMILWYKCFIKSWLRF